MFLEDNEYGSDFYYSSVNDDFEDEISHSGYPIHSHSQFKKCPYNYFTTNGTSKNHSIGYSERNNSNICKTESVSISELLTEHNVDSSLISNCINRKKSMTTTDEINVMKIESTFENSTIITSRKDIDVIKNIDKLKNSYFHINYDFTLNNNDYDDDDFYEVIIYKKVLRILNVFSCYKLDDRHEYSKYTKNLEITDIDYQLLDEINKSNNSVNEKYETFSGKLGYFNLQMKCSDNDDKEKCFITEENEFSYIKNTYKDNLENDGTALVYNAMPNYLELTSTNGDYSIKSIQNSPDSTEAIILVNSKGNIKLTKGNKIYFNTETGNISENATFRISEKNHLEVYIKYEKGDCIFGFDGDYASEFENVDYSVNPELDNISTNIIKNSESEKCNCQKYEICQKIINLKNTTDMMDECYTYDFSTFSSICKNECSDGKNDNIINKKSTLNIRDEYLERLTDISNFNVPNDVVIWSSVRPEHQHLTVGWNGNKNKDEYSYLVINSHSFNDSSNYEGMTLYDPNRIAIWMLDINHPNRNNEYLDSNGYYLPFKYGYPFKNGNITNQIPEKYTLKKYPYLTIPKNVEYKGNILYFGGCDNSLKSPNDKGKLEGLISKNGRFRLILKEDGNLIFKDNHVTIWESKTSNLWQGKAPYKLIIGKDGVMRILNKLDYVILSTFNKKIEYNNEYSNYRLEVLNAGTFRIVNENGEEVWNMWSHGDYHEFNIYLEEEIYNSCSQEIRNLNLPFLSTKSDDDSIIRVGEQLINTFTGVEYHKIYDSFTRTHGHHYNNNNNNSNNNYYYTARLKLSNDKLLYENTYNKAFDLGCVYLNLLEPIIEKNPNISYGKLNNNGLFNIYDSKDHILFSTGLKGEVCEDSNKCFYFMYISSDHYGIINIVKRKFITNEYIDSLIWSFPGNRNIREMRSDRDDHYLNNLESLVYRKDFGYNTDIYQKNIILDNNQNYTLFNNCKIVYNYSCLTLKPDGVYLYGNSKPYFEYETQLNSTLYLDRRNGYLSLDGIDVLGMKNKFISLPTKIQCEVINGIYGVRLLDKYNSTIWEYPNSKILKLTNENFNNTMAVGNSIYYYNNNEKYFENCLEFQPTGLLNNNGTNIVEFHSKIENSILYLNNTELTIIDKNDVITPVIKFNNPEGHDVELYCRSINEIVIADKITQNILWSYPTKKYSILSTNSIQNQLQPYQELVMKDDVENRFCLKIINNEIYNQDYNIPVISKDEQGNGIEYLQITDYGVLIHYSNDTIINLINKSHVNKSKNIGVYNIKCEMQYGLLKAVIYCDDKYIMSIPDYNKKYEITFNDSLYYGEKLYKKGTKGEPDEACLIFDNNKLYVNIYNYTIFDIFNNNYRENQFVDSNKNNYININEKSLKLNNDISIFNITNVGDSDIIGKCMDYHGMNKFVLYNPSNDKVLSEFPPVEMKTVLKENDTMFDKIYIDNGKFNTPCIRMDTVNTKDDKDKIGLFFNLDIVPMNNTITTYSIPNNNTLKFDQEKGLLLLNGINVLEETFNSQHLELNCKMENNKLYAIIEDNTGKEYWRYPKKEKENPISSSTTIITTFLTKYVTKTKTNVVTKTSYSYTTYTNVSYLGSLGSNYYLGVNELKEYTTILAKYGGNKQNPSKYNKWLIKFENKPSYFYLANKNGGLSNYCLNVGKSKNKNSFYLTISKCSKTTYMFKYNVPFTDSNGLKITSSPNIAVYKNSNTLFTNNKGIPYCLYYTDTLRIEECKFTKIVENFKWIKVKYKDRYYTQTTPKTEIRTSTKYITTSTLIPTVITTNAPIPTN